MFIRVSAVRKPESAQERLGLDIDEEVELVTYSLILNTEMVVSADDEEFDDLIRVCTTDSGEHYVDMAIGDFYRFLVQRPSLN